MKLGPPSILDPQPVKSLKQLLQEVSTGQYQNFKDYLLLNNISCLDLFQKAHHVDLTHLGCALKGTPVTTLDLSGNNIGPDGAEKLGIGLKGTSVISLNLLGNNIRAEGAEKLGIALKESAVMTLNVRSNNLGPDGAEVLIITLKETAVTILDLSSNRIGPDGAEKIGKALNGTSVTILNVSSNNLGPDGAEELAKALKGSKVTTLNVGLNCLDIQSAQNVVIALKDTAVTTLYLSGNHISAEGAAALATCIPGTLLMKVVLTIEHKVLKQALVLNERKLIQTPYIAICLKHLPENVKNKYYHLPALPNNPSEGEKVSFAGGILASLGTFAPELQAKIISYLPLMNYKRAEKLQELANEYHGKNGLQIEAQENRTYECTIQ